VSVRTKLRGGDPALVADHSRISAGMMIMKDGHDHRRLRGSSKHAFTPTALDRWHLGAPRRPERRRDSARPRGRLRTVTEYIEEHLDAGPSLEQMAAVARLSLYHFARQFKQATGLPPHQYVILRRVERAKWSGVIAPLTATSNRRRDQ
jgi:hypothetical protein